MSGPTRHDTRIEDGTLYLDRDPEPVEVGSMDGVVELIGGETYTLEYTKKQAAAAWIDTDEDNSITIDVREEVAGMAFMDDFVDAVEAEPADETGESGYSRRAERFADLMREILDSKGELDLEDE